MPTMAQEVPEGCFAFIKKYHTYPLSRPPMDCLPLRLHGVIIRPSVAIVNHYFINIAMPDS
jgi:hypothetical protein